VGGIPRDRYEGVYADLDTLSVLAEIDAPTFDGLDESSADDTSVWTSLSWFASEVRASRGPGASRLLDIGAGLSPVTAALADVSTPALVMALDYAVGASVARQKSAPRAEVVPIAANATRLPLRFSSIDGALSVDALHCMPVRAAIAEVARVLRPSAPLLLTTLWCRTQKVRTTDLSPVEWRECLAQNGFKISFFRDDTDRWRVTARAKHLGRWKHRHRMRCALGARAEAHLAVTRAMLGDGGAGMIDRTCAAVIGATREPLRRRALLHLR
jgi:SAM-dependent methyltransferase